MEIFENKKQKTNEVSIYDNGENIYLKIGKTYYDTKNNTFDLLKKIYEKGYADLTPYKKVDICLGF